MTARLDLSFAEFFAHSPKASRRLSNLILRAVDDAGGAYPTVLEYWEDRHSARHQLCAIHGFGAKSMEELDRRIAAFLTDEAA